MSLLQFTPATRHEAKARVALIGPTGAGKTWTALEWATVLAGTEGRIGVIDTENDSASLYSDTYRFQSAAWRPPYDPAKLAAAIGDAARQFDVLIVDSLTHFWQGDGGVLDIVEQEGARTRNQFAGWKKGTPLWRGILDALIFAPCHVVVTMRSKMDYVQQQGSDGRMKVEKMGMAPVARNDVEYEFTVVGELDQAHRLTVTKSRCSALADKVAPAHQARKLAEELAAWLGTAAAAPTTPPQDAPSAPAEPAGYTGGRVSATGITDTQMRKLQALLAQKGYRDRASAIDYVSRTIGRTVASRNELSKAEGIAAIDALEQLPDVGPSA
jgi:hypothetical protein